MKGAAQHPDTDGQLLDLDCRITEQTRQGTGAQGLTLSRSDTHTYVTNNAEAAIHQAAVPSARAPALGGKASTTSAAARYATAAAEGAAVTGM